MNSDDGSKCYSTLVNHAFLNFSITVLQLSDSSSSDRGRFTQGRGGYRGGESVSFRGRGSFSGGRSYGRSDSDRKFDSRGPRGNFNRDFQNGAGRESRPGGVKETTSVKN